jgi:Flp pilus assembly pilin Flp
MSNALLAIYARATVVALALKDERGQDLVEYALVIAVVCLGIISGMGTLASGINTAMSTLSGNINSAVS